MAGLYSATILLAYATKNRYVRTGKMIYDLTTTYRNPLQPRRISFSRVAGRERHKADVSQMSAVETLAGKKASWSPEHRER